MNWFLITAAAGTVAAIPLFVRRPVYAVAAAFGLSGILMSTDLPLVGSRLALPDIPILIAIVAAGWYLFRATSGSHADSGRGSRLKSRLGASLFEFAPDITVRYALLFAGIFWVWSALAWFTGVVFFEADALAASITLANYLYGILMMLAVVVLVRDWRSFRVCLIAWLLGVAVVSIFSVTSTLGIGPEWASRSDSYRIESTFRRVNQMHSYVAPALMLAFGFMIAKDSRWWWRIISVLIFLGAAVALFASGARTALGLFALAVLACLGYSLSFARKNPVVVAVAILLAVAAVAAGTYIWVAVAEGGRNALPEWMIPVVRPIWLLQRGGDLEQFLGPRGEQLRIVADNWSAHPVTGVGPSNFADFYDNSHELHNSYLGTLMEQGIPAFLALLASLGYVLAAAWRAIAHESNGARSVLLTMTAIAFILILAYGVMTFGLRQRIFWITAGLLLSAVGVVFRENAGTGSNSE